MLVGGDGRPSGVPRHILHLVRALQGQMNLTVISDQDQGGYTDLSQTSAQHVVIKGLTNKLSLRHHWVGQRNLLKTLGSSKADVIWIHARLQVLLLRILLTLHLWRPECPVIFTHHGLPYGRGYHPLVHRICKALEQGLVACSPPQNLVFLNHRMAGTMARDTQAIQLARHRVHILPNCSDTRPLSRQRNPQVRTLVMTGRTGRQKDYDVAARLLSHLPEDFRLNLCGPGTQMPAFQNHIAGLVPADVFSRITFSGPLPDIRVPLAQADAYLLTSRYEGTPIGALEAFEAGLPIILRNFDGAQDLVSKHPCSLMFDANDLAGEAQMIIRLIERFHRNEDTFRAAIQDVWRETWSPEIFARNAQMLVRSVLKQPMDQVAKQGCVHDDQALRPDHRKIPDAPFPIPRPSYTSAAPSAENGSPQ